MVTEDQQDPLDQEEEEEHLEKEEMMDQ